ncbi:hypothetical protein F5Y15DRAFT_428570 [Xylariaceae sp. FL0016]|nr:hypothetical protein F5Y15DRAFT_428570 [Xylariaceae sp. FL0016]
MAQIQMRRFPPDDSSWDKTQLHESLWELYKTMLRVLPDLIERLSPGTFIKKAMSSFRGQNLDMLLGKTDTSSDRVKRCAECLMDDLVVNTYETVTDSHKTTVDLHKATQDAGQGINELRKQVKEILCLTTDNLSRDGTLNDIPACPSILPFEVLRLLDVHHLGSIDDQMDVLRLSQSLDLDSVSRAAGLVRSPRVKQLLHSPAAGLVLVEGCGERGQIGRVAPISYVCATLSETLRAANQKFDASSITLLFFCGRHIDPGDMLRGPQGLMRSLLAQLIMELPRNDWLADSVPIEFPHLESSELERLALEDVCELFHPLLGRVPRGGSVFCLVDGISSYRSPEWQGDLYIVTRCFRTVLADEGLGAHLKILMTSPTRKLDLVGLQANQRVTLRSETALLTRRDVTAAVRSVVPPDYR